MQDTIMTDCKKRIIDAWEHQVRKRNVDKITIKDITDECGVSRQTFYYYFRDLQDVMESVMRQGNEDTMAQCIKKATFAEGMDYYLQDFLSFYQVIRAMKCSSYSARYGELLTRNNIQVLECLIATFYPNSPCNDSRLKTLIEMVSCGLTGLIYQHCERQDIDHQLISRQTAGIFEAAISFYMGAPDTTIQKT